MNALARVADARTIRIEDELARRGFSFWTKACNNNRGAPCPMCDGTDRFRVNTTKQLFLCSKCGAKGDVIALVQALDGVGFLDAIAYLAGAEPSSIVSNIRKQPGPIVKQRDEAAERQRSINAARLIWARRRPIAGTIADHYFRFRGLTIDEDLSHCIGFDPEASWREVANDPASPMLRVPCILTAFRSIETDEIVAVQKTRLNADGSKFGRRFNGCAKGAVCKIDRDEDVRHGLSIAEGLETALSARVVGYRPVWATGGTGTLENFPVLAGVESLILQRENDEANARAADRCAERWMAAGKEILDAFPPPDCNDFNDCLQKRIARA